jgi:hypothetical protein
VAVTFWNYVVCLFVGTIFRAWRSFCLFENENGITVVNLKQNYQIGGGRDL